MYIICTMFFFFEVFEALKKDYSEQLRKICVIAGDCLQPKLGMSDENRELLKREVNVVFHVAATVKFDAPLKYAVHMNIRSTSDMLDLAREMKQLKVSGSANVYIEY